MSNQTHTIEATLPDCVEPGMSTYIHCEAGVDVAGAVALLDEIRRELDPNARLDRQYTSAPPSITYKLREGELVVILKLPNAEPGEREPEDVEALMRKAAQPTSATGASDA